MHVHKKQTSDHIPNLPYLLIIRQSQLFYIRLLLPRVAPHLFLIEFVFYKDYHCSKHSQTPSTAYRKTTPTMSDDNTSSLKAYIDSATGAVQSAIGSLTGNSADQVSSPIQSSPSPPPNPLTPPGRRLTNQIPRRRRARRLPRRRQARAHRGLRLRWRNAR